MNHAEATLFAHLTDPDSLDILVREGFSVEQTREVIPTEMARTIVAWCLDLYFASGRTIAPSKEAIAETWSEEMEQADLAIEDDTETDTIDWAVDELRSHYVEYRSQQFIHELGKAINAAPPPERVPVLKQYAGQLHELAQTVISHRQESPTDRGIEDALVRYHERANSNTFISGLTFGLPPIDNHVMGVHDGELAVFAAFAGVGKSFVAIKAMLAEWLRGRKTVLFTLENDLPMTFDRIACMRGRVPYEDWQRGVAAEQCMNRVKEFLALIQDSEHAPLVIMPERGDRTALAMVRRAFSLGAESIIVDQLSHVERRSGSKARERRDVFSENISEIKALISEGREKLPALVLHQIKREGQKEARKSGKYYMDDLAESSQIEREADFVFSAHVNPDDTSQALWQTLKARRVPPRDWTMHWRLDVGDIRVAQEVTRGGDE